MSLVQIPAAAIRDTAAAVFRNPAYTRESFMHRLGTWVLDLLRALFAQLRPGRAPAPVFWVVVGVLGLLLVGLLARLLFGVRLGRRGAARRGAGVGPSSPGELDPWSAAQRLAERGDYTAGAHALYAAILGAIAGRGDIELRESKTVGDYMRELAARSSGALARFRDFARSYEATIYGLGACDRERYERLRGLAVRLVEGNA